MGAGEMNWPNYEVNQRMSNVGTLLRDLAQPIVTINASSSFALHSRRTRLTRRPPSMHEALVVPAVYSVLPLFLECLQMNIQIHTLCSINCVWKQIQSVESSSRRFNSHNRSKTSPHKTIKQNKNNHCYLNCISTLKCLKFCSEMGFCMLYFSKKNNCIVLYSTIVALWDSSSPYSLKVF